MSHTPAPYRLVASLDGAQHEGIAFWEPSDSEAGMKAVSLVLARSHADPHGPWAVGRVVLYSPKGEVLQHFR